MTLQITKQPSNLNLTGNPISVVLKNTNGIIETLGSKGMFTFTCGLTAVENDSFSLNFGNIVLNFVFKVNPDDSTLQLPLVNGMDLGEYMQAIYSIFIRQYYLIKIFDIVYLGYEIMFTAKSIGTQNNLVLKPISGNYVSLNTTMLGVNTIYKENYQILLQTYVYINGIKSLVNEDLLNTDTNNEASFDIADYLKPFILSEFSYPEKIGTDLLSYKPKGIVSFEFVIAEKYNDVIRSLTPINTKYYALSGGISNEDLKFYNGYNTNYFDFSNNKYRFLTWQPNDKIVSKVQTEKLFFFTSEHRSIDISCKMYYTDGSVHTFKIADATSVNQFSIYELICGYKSLDLNQYFPDKIVLKYEIILIGATTTEYFDEVIDPNLFNTAWDGLNGTLPVGYRDNQWLVGLGDGTGLESVLEFIPAYVSTPDPTWIISPNNKTAWISLYEDSVHSGDKDYFFKTSFNIQDINPAEFILNLILKADNSIFEIYVNDKPQSVNYPELFPESATDPYNHLGFTDQFADIVLNLALDWVLGNNTIAIWVKSSEPKMGLLCQGLSTSLQTLGGPDLSHIYDKHFEKRTYWIDHSFHQNEKYYIFKNSLNTWDSLRCTGEHIKSIEINRQSASVLSDLIGSENKDVSIEYDQTFKANTGWTDHLCQDTKAYFNYLKEFLISKEVYEVNGDMLVPIKLTSKKVNLHNNKEFVYNLSFSYTYTSKEEFFSDEVGLEDIQFLTDDLGMGITDNTGTPLFK